MLYVFSYTVCHLNGNLDKISVKECSELEADKKALEKVEKTDILVSNGLIACVCR